MPIKSNAPSAHVRTVQDEHGRTWKVQEHSGGAYDRRSRCSLVFDAGDAMRRVWSYPPNWYRLSADDLLALSVAPVHP